MVQFACGVCTRARPLQTYVSKYFRDNTPGFGVYGHLPLVDLEQNPVPEGEKQVACYLREPKEALETSPVDSRNIDKLNACVKGESCVLLVNLCAADDFLTIHLRVCVRARVSITRAPSEHFDVKALLKDLKLG